GGDSAFSPAPPGITSPAPDRSYNRRRVAPGARRALPLCGGRSMRLTLALIVLVLGVARLRADDFPQTVLRNDALALTVYLPDAAKGFYRGTRFDWAGVVGAVQFDGHTLFGPWKEKHD